MTDYGWWELAANLAFIAGVFCIYALILHFQRKDNQ